MSGALRAAFGAGAAGLLGALPGCSTASDIKLGINSGSQTLWRYLAARKDQILTPLGYRTQFLSYESEQAVQQAFREAKIDVIATIASQLPLLASPTPVQIITPIAWIAQTLPIVVGEAMDAQSLPDLAGKRLAVPPAGDPGYAYWRAFALANYNFRIEDRISVVEGLPDIPGALVSGQVDAAVVASLAWATLKATGRYRVIGDLGSEWQRVAPTAKPLIFGAFVARKSWVDSNQKFADDLIRVNSEAMGLYKNANEGFIKVAADYPNPPFGTMQPAEVQTVATYLGMDAVGPGRAYANETDASDLGRAFELLTRVGFLPDKARIPADYFYISRNRPTG